MTGEMPSFQTVDQQVYANGAKHIYATDAEGNRHHVSHAAILESHGYEAEKNLKLIPAVAEAAHEPTLGAAKLEKEQIKNHAKWQLNVDTTDNKPSATELTPDDIAYNMWLGENATDNKGTTLNAKAKNAENAERLEQLREKARFNMRVKTGMATGEESAYYFTLKEMEVDARVKAEKAISKDQPSEHDAAVSKIANEIISTVDTRIAEQNAASTNEDPDFFDDEPVILDEDDNEDPEADQYIPNTDESEEAVEELTEDQNSNHESPTKERRSAKVLNKIKNRRKRSLLPLQAVAVGAKSRLNANKAEKDTNKERKSRKGKIAFVGAVALGAVAYAEYKANQNGGSVVGKVKDMLPFGGGDKLSKVGDAANLDAEKHVPHYGRGVASTEEVSKVVSGLANKSSSVLSFDKPWKPGNPTPWSWAQSLGIKNNNNIHGFLQEVYGVDSWEKASKLATEMPVGSKLTASPELIAKYKG